uniref:MBL fold metallo-hydrolase n=1 Tax=uncultured Dysgonomonas sp. TaxID=206096 RepID=UPI0025828DBA|nr:MBL fold metallo-hydrolase [uncultured Dysgonomonas sp.]
MKLICLGSSSKGNCYLFESKSQVLILEAGLPLKAVKEALNFDMSRVAGCIISHLHSDHSKCAEDFIKNGIHIYANTETIDHITKGIDSSLTTRIYASGKQGSRFSVGDFRIVPFSVKHDVPTFGFLIQHEEMGLCAFVTDTHYIPNTFKGLNQILIEANYEERILNENYIDGKIDNSRYQRVLRSHMSLETCVEALKANDLKGVQNIVLIHLSPQNSDAKLFKNKVIEVTGKNVHIALKGLVIDFNKEPF